MNLSRRRPVSACSGRLVAVVAAWLGIAIGAGGADLYRTNATGTWADGTWVDAGGSPAVPGAGDVVYIGTDHGPAGTLTTASVTLTNGTVTVNDLRVGYDTDNGADSEDGTLTVTNSGTHLVVQNDAHFGKHRTFGVGHLDIGPGAMLTVSNRFQVNNSTVTVNGDRLWVGGDFWLGDSSWNYQVSRFTQDGGTLSVGNDFYMCPQIRNSAYLKLTNAAVLNIGGHLQLGKNNANAQFYGLDIGPGCMVNVAGNFQHGNRSVSFNGDRFSVDGSLSIGWLGSYTLTDCTQDGGQLVVDSLLMPGYSSHYGANPGFRLSNNATLSVRRASSEVWSWIGQSSHIYSGGECYIGTAADPGTINAYETGDTGKLSLRILRESNWAPNSPDDQGTIFLKGWGRVDLDGTLENNGKVVADGYGADRDLVMTNFSAVTQDEASEHNTYFGFMMADGSQVGWYAENGGRLLLPVLTGLTANATVRWGDNIDDTTTVSTNDPVNSLILDFNNCVGGDVAVSLLAQDRADHDATNDSVVGVWNIDGSGFDFGGSGTVTIGFRYDGPQVAAKVLPEGSLKAWQYSGGTWNDVTGNTDTTNDVVTTIALSNFSAFAVSTLAPSAAGGVALPLDLYRTNAVGLWNDGSWIDSGSSSAPDPTPIDACYVGGDDGVGVVDVTVTITGLTVSVSNLYVGVDNNGANNGESGKVVLTNGASITMRDLGIGSDMALSGQYGNGEIDMAPGTTLTVHRDVDLNASSWTIRSNHTVTIGGNVTLNNYAGTVLRTARLTIDGGTRNIPGDLALGNSTAYGYHSYLVVTNNGTLNVGGDFLSGYHYANLTTDDIDIAPGSMLNISNDFLWRASGNTGVVSGAGLTVGGSLIMGGSQRHARLAIDGGRLEVDSLIVAASYYSDINRLLLINNASIGLRRPASGDVVNRIGQDGHLEPNESTVYLGTATDPGTIDIEEDGGTGTHSLVLSRDYPTAGNGIAAVMTLTGWGSVDLDGTLENNGKIIADGYGTDRDLELTNFAAIVQNESHEDQVATGFVLKDGSRAGWYAVNGGRLVLPTVTGLTANATVRWGDDVDDVTTVDSNDLVNSVLLDFTNVVGGDLVVSLLSSNYTAAAVTNPTATIGVWQFEASSFDMGTGTATFTFRYDDPLAQARGLTEANLKVWRYDGFWKDASGSVDTDTKTVTSRPLTALGILAVAAEIPGEPPPKGTLFLVR